MPRAFLITHRRYNGVEEEIAGSERGTLFLSSRAATSIKKLISFNLIIMINQSKVRKLKSIKNFIGKNTLK